MKRPLLLPALLLIGGILLGQIARPGLLFLFTASFVLALAALAWNAGRVWLLALLLVLTGWTDGCWHAAILSPHDLRLLLNPQARLVTLRGVITAPPSQRIYERRQGEYWRTSALVDVSAIRLDGVWSPAVGTVVAGCPGILPENVFEGGNVEVTGIIQSPRGPLAEGLFDARAYYERQGIYFQLQTQNATDWTTPPEDTRAHPPFSERFRKWATNTLALGLPPNDPALNLTWTLLLDWKAPLTGSVEEPFLRSGTYHIFAVDGLRIGLLAGIGLGLLRLLRLPREVCGLLVLPIIWFYAGLTGWPASAVRAAIMFTVIIVGWACRRPGDLINSLFAAAIIVLLWLPSQLFQPGFQLSFLVVLCIAVILPLARQTLLGWLFQGDPFVPETLRSRWPAVFLVPTTFVVETLAVSFAAWVGSMPLAAYYFHLFTPASLPANCVVVPATALALMSAIASLLTGGWFPSLAILFNNATWVLMKFIIWFSGCAAHWPGAYFNAAAPSLGFCVFFYALLLMAATGWIFRSRFRWAGVTALAALGVALAAHWALGLSTARLYVVPMDGAPVILDEPPGFGGKVLIDCGNDTAAREYLVPFLAARGINRLDALCLADTRMPFSGGATIILTEFPAAAVFSGAAQTSSSALRAPSPDLRPLASVRTVKDGDQMDGWAVLHPGATDQFSRSDDNAIVLQRRLNGQSVLLLPALGRAGQDALIRRHPELRADIVVAGLPTRDEPLSDPLLDLVRPRLIVIADSAYPAYNRAPFTLRQRLARQPARVIYLRDIGSLTMEFSGHNPSLRAADGSPVTNSVPTGAKESSP